MALNSLPADKVAATAQIHASRISPGRRATNVPGEGGVNFRGLLSLIPEIGEEHFIAEFDW